MKALTVLFIFLGFSTIVFSATIFVPDDYPTIQGAIDASVNGDTIIVKPGTYVENIDFIGKAITVQSEQGVYLTVIDGNQTGSAVKFQNGEGLDSVLEGFTVRNGSGTELNSDGYGGGIFCKKSSPLILNNIITNNTIIGNYKYGGGVCCLQMSSPIISNNIISNNNIGSYYGHDGGGIYFRDDSSPIINSNVIISNSSFWGGGIYCNQSSTTPIITNNLIINNVALHGAGIVCNVYATPSIINNTICRNLASVRGGGMLCWTSSSPVITNSIMWNNNSPTAPSIYVMNANPIVTYSDIQGGWSGTGNINVDPLFSDPSNGDFHLTWHSQCGNAGDNNTTALPTFDYEGDPRVEGSAVDIGADEYAYHLYYVGDVIPGNSIDVKIVGMPGIPVSLGLGSGIQNPPLSTHYGYFYLALPLLGNWYLGTIPSNGISSLPVKIPFSSQAGDVYPLQSLKGKMGWPHSKLSNLMVLTVK